jgi:hypothetical protein
MYTSIASPYQNKKIDVKCSPTLGLHLFTKSAAHHSSQVLSTCYLTLVWLVTQTKIWQHYYTFWAQNDT